MSAASITKAFLDKMGIEHPSQKFDLPDEILGKCMQAYYGGRSEIRIRHQEVPIVVCDTTSEYPSVAGLLGLWPLLTAASMEVAECTEEARKALDGVNVEGVLNPLKWLEVAFFALIKPSGDVLPVRALYSDTGNTNIGLNPLTVRRADLVYRARSGCVQTCNGTLPRNHSGFQARSARCAKGP